MPYSTLGQCRLLCLPVGCHRSLLIRPVARHATCDSWPTEPCQAGQPASEWFCLGQKLCLTFFVFANSFSEACIQSFGGWTYGIGAIRCPVPRREILWEWDKQSDGTFVSLWLFIAASLFIIFNWIWPTRQRQLPDIDENRSEDQYINQLITHRIH